MAAFPGVALVVGAATGIGRSVAVSFAARGCGRLAILDYNDAGLKETKRLAEAAAPGVQITSLKADVRDEKDIVGNITHAIGNFGRIDYAVNSAGIQGIPGPSDAVKTSDFDDLLNTNFRGLWLCSREQLRQMKIQEPLPTHDGRPGSRGAVVNVSSMLAHIGQPFLPAYTATKHAILGLTRSDALAYAPHNIRVNCVCPGPTDTPMAANFADDHPAVLAGPAQRKCRPQEVADVVLFLTSSQASFVQGAHFNVDGGYVVP